jgi:hypothetical protein
VIIGVKRLLGLPQCKPAEKRIPAGSCSVAESVHPARTSVDRRFNKVEIASDNVVRGRLQLAASIQHGGKACSMAITSRQVEIKEEDRSGAMSERGDAQGEDVTLGGRIYLKLSDGAMMVDGRRDEYGYSARAIALVGVEHTPPRHYVCE